MPDGMIVHTPRLSRAGKFLTLSLGETSYGLDILKVREIVGVVATTTIPGSPRSLRGVMNLRGRIIPVIEIRRVLEMADVEDDTETRIVVIETDGMEVGIVVDRVDDAIEIADTELADAPSFGMVVRSEFVQSVGQNGEQMTILLDIDKLVASAGFSVFGEETVEPSDLQS